MAVSLPEHAQSRRRRQQGRGLQSGSNPMAKRSKAIMEPKHQSSEYNLIYCVI